MSKFTSELVDSYANKLLFNLTHEENEMVLDEFDIIEETINLINEIDGLSDLEPMTHALDNLDIELREDIPEESIKLEDALRNAGKTEGREIEVPKVVD